MKVEHGNGAIESVYITVDVIRTDEQAQKFFFPINSDDYRIDLAVRVDANEVGGKRVQIRVEQKS